MNRDIIAGLKKRKTEFEKLLDEWCDNPTSKDDLLIYMTSIYSMDYAISLVEKHAESILTELEDAFLKVFRDAPEELARWDMIAAVKNIEKNYQKKKKFATKR